MPVEGSWVATTSAGLPVSFEVKEGNVLNAQGTFVAPDRVEGAVAAEGRELPGCPRTQATFVAAPGEAPPYVKP